MSNPITWVAVDQGYSNTKAVSSHNGRSVIFPSLVVGGHERLSFGGSSRGNPDDVSNMHVLVEDQDNTLEYFVGDLAVRESQTASFMFSQDRINDPRSMALVYTSIAKLTSDLPVYDHMKINLALGLPLKYYSEMKAPMEKKFRNNSFKISFKSGGNKETRSFTINQVSVWPQAAGAIWSQLFSADGQIKKFNSRMFVALVDIGFKTTDYIAVDISSGLHIRSDLSGTIENGMSQVLTQARRSFEEQVGSTIDSNLFEGLISNGHEVTFRKKVYDLSDIIKKAEMEVATNIKDNMRLAWGQKVDFMDRVYLAGGGASGLYKYFEKDFETQVILASRPQMANANGFLMMAQRNQK